MDTMDDPNFYANNSGLCGMQIRVPCPENLSPPEVERVRKHGSRGKECGLDMQFSSLKQWETYILLGILSLQNLQITAANKGGKGYKFQVYYKLCMQSQRFSVKQSNK
ncbi:receptor-like protein 46 [Fagus crenata]